MHFHLEVSLIVLTIALCVPCGVLLHVWDPVQCDGNTTQPYSEWPLWLYHCWYLVFYPWNICGPCISNSSTVKCIWVHGEVHKLLLAEWMGTCNGIAEGGESLTMLRSTLVCPVMWHEYTTHKWLQTWMLTRVYSPLNQENNITMDAKVLVRQTIVGLMCAWAAALVCSRLWHYCKLHLWLSQCQVCVTASVVYREPICLLEYYLFIDTCSRHSAWITVTCSFWYFWCQLLVQSWFLTISPLDMTLAQLSHSRPDHSMHAQPGAHTSSLVRKPFTSV